LPVDRTPTPSSSPKRRSRVARLDRAMNEERARDLARVEEILAFRAAEKKRTSRRRYRNG